MTAHQWTGTALAVLAIIVLGCGQATGPTDSAAATASPSPTTSVAATATTAAILQAPVEFTGTIRCGPPVNPDTEGTEETLEIGEEGMLLSRSRGATWEQSVTMSDPRLEGAIYYTGEGDEYRVAGAEQGPEVWAWTRRVVNADGAWEARGYGGRFPDGRPIGAAGLETPEVWIGEGAYEGLVAVMEVAEQVAGGCDVVVRGVIFDGAPAPQAYHPD